MTDLSADRVDLPRRPGTADARGPGRVPGRRLPGPGGPPARRAAARRPPRGRQLPERVRRGDHGRLRADRRAARHGHRPVQADGADRRGRHGPGLRRRAAAARPPQGRAQDHQAGHGHPRRHRPVRGRAAGPGADGPPQHRPGVRRRHDRQRPALLRDGAGQGACRSSSTATGSSSRTRERLELFVDVCQAVQHAHAKGDHPPRPEAVEHPGGAARRRARGQGDRLRRGQGHRPAVHRQDDLHPVPADDRHAAVHEPRAGRDQRPGRGHPQRRLQPGRAPLRAADRHDAVRPRAVRDGGLRRDPPHHQGGGAAQAEHAAEHAGRDALEGLRRSGRPSRRSCRPWCAATSTGS